MSVKHASCRSRSQAAFHLALERRVLELGEICCRQGQTLNVQCEAFACGLDELIAWLRVELDQRRHATASDGGSVAPGWWLADERFLSLLVLHRRSLLRGGSDHYALCRELLLHTAPVWLEYRRLAHGFARVPSRIWPTSLSASGKLALLPTKLP